MNPSPGNGNGIRAARILYPLPWFVRLAERPLPRQSVEHRVRAAIPYRPGIAGRFSKTAPAPASGDCSAHPAEPFLAIDYKVLSIPVASDVLSSLLGVLISPIRASAAMRLSSLSVVGNALRLRRVVL